MAAGFVSIGTLFVGVMNRRAGWSQKTPLSVKVKERLQNSFTSANDLHEHPAVVV